LEEQVTVTPSTEVSIMSRYSPQERARILAQARKHLAGRRAEVLRKKHELMLENMKMNERQRAREPQQSSGSSGAPDFDRDMLIDLVAAILGVVLRRQS
jgi:hypothetical protein